MGTPGHGAWTRFAETSARAGDGDPHPAPPVSGAPPRAEIILIEFRSPRCLSLQCRAFVASASK